MSTRLICLALAIATLATIAVAQFLTPDALDWEKVRAAQPKGVILELAIPKAEYHMGEVIEATLTFSNASAELYHVGTGTYDRSGRIPDMGIYAFDSEGKPVPDPLRWYFQRGGIGGGLSGGDKDLGEWKITLPANQWLRFEKPGTYTLRAYSYRVQKGDSYERGSPPERQVELVSDPVTITITALDSENERRIIEESIAGLGAGGKQANSAATTLRYLGTPASRAALLPLIVGPHSFEATMAFYAAPDPAAEAPAVLDAVRTGKLKFDSGIPNFYGTLKTGNFRFNFSEGAREEMEALGKQVMAVRKAASEEITAVATDATGGKGPEYNQTLIHKLFRDVAKRPQARAELAKVQLELTPEQAKTILTSWKDFVGEDFLPLVRKSVGEPTYSTDALMALAKIKPDEARALIIEDIQRDKPHYLNHGAVSEIANRPFLSLPAEPIPELQTFFQSQLRRKEPPNAQLLIAAISRYGTAVLLPDVIAYYTPGEGKWTSSIQADVLKMWLRWDTDGGVEALKRALVPKGRSRAYTRVLTEVLLDEWNDAALPVVVAALDDPDAEVVLSAVKVLEAYHDAKYLSPSVAAVLRINTAASKANLAAYEAARGGAFVLLQSIRWKPDEAQKQALEGVLSSRPK